jgi:hypothetical protein
MHLYKHIKAISESIFLTSSSMYDFSFFLLERETENSAVMISLYVV